MRNDHLKNPAEREEPTCTRSQAIRYFDADGRWIVEVHRYLRPDGTLGGSGRADPKRLRLSNRILILQKSCPAQHLEYVISGRLKVRMDDGSVRTLRQKTAPEKGAHVTVEGSTLQVSKAATSA